MPGLRIGSAVLGIALAVFCGCGDGDEDGDVSGVWNTAGSGGGGSGGSGGAATGGSGGASSDAQHCVDVINGYRTQNGLTALPRSAELEACAMAAAESDAQTGTPHGYFRSTSGCGIADAENEIPGWPLGSYGSVTSIIDQGTEMMMDEGPGGGHYENILGNHTGVGCGIHVTSGNEVWVVQDFR